MQNESMMFDWMSLTGPHPPNCLCIHPDMSCFSFVVLKIFQVMKKGLKFYLPLHIIPFMLKIKRIKRQGRVKQETIRAFKNFFKSITFMCHIVGFSKTVLCMSNKIPPYKINGVVFWWASFSAAISIFWESPGKRQQISYFAFVRCIRSIYIAMKRRRLLILKNQMKICFIGIFGLISYIFFQQPALLKHKNYFQKIWGNP